MFGTQKKLRHFLALILSMPSRWHLALVRCRRNVSVIEGENSGEKGKILWCAVCVKRIKLRVVLLLHGRRMPNSGNFCYFHPYLTSMGCVWFFMNGR
jgi:hypothetical protein